MPAWVCRKHEGGRGGAGRWERAPRPGVEGAAWRARRNRIRELAQTG